VKQKKYPKDYSLEVKWSLGQEEKKERIPLPQLHKIEGNPVKMS